RARPAGWSPGGKGHLQLDVLYPGGWSQADEGDRILFQEFRLACDRRSGRQTRDEVITEHDRAVKIGNHIPDPEPSRARLDLGPAADRVAAEPVDAGDDEATVVIQDPDQVRVGSAELASMRAPAQDGGGPVEPGISQEEIPIPILPPEELSLAELGEVGRQGRMQVWTADQFDAEAVGQQAAESPAPKRVRGAGQILAALLVEQPFPGFDVPPDAVQDPLQSRRRPARKERFP